MPDYFAKILAAFEHIHAALRSAAVSPMALPHLGRVAMAVQELRAELPPLSEVEARISALEKAVADLRGSPADAP